MDKHISTYRHIWGRRFIFAGIALCFLWAASSASPLRKTLPADTVKHLSGEDRAVNPAHSEYAAPVNPGYLHRLSAELRPGYVAQTNAFLRGNNFQNTPIDRSYSAHLKYAFQFNPASREGRLYGLPYQGVGFSVNTFQNRDELGDPWAAYLFQGARIAAFSPVFSLNYEWNLGLSWGWRPYDMNNNYYNYSIGSRINAYMNIDFYLNWALSRQTDLVAGVSFTHFSNGNTKLPNSGVNIIAGKIGAVYHFNRQDRRNLFLPVAREEYARHMSYELLLFGSWRSKGLQDEDGILPFSIRSFGVAGASFASMYHWGRRVRVGAAVDAVYDGSANVFYREDYSGVSGVQYITPPLHKQMALGLSARVDYAMPFFTISLGLGYDVIHIGSDLKSFYQMLSLKIDMTHNTYLNVGYRLKNFDTPNFLMLGVGFRFNYRRP